MPAAYPELVSASVARRCLTSSKTRHPKVSQGLNVDQQEVERSAGERPKLNDYPHSSPDPTLGGGNRTHSMPTGACHKGPSSGAMCSRFHITFRAADFAADNYGLHGENQSGETLANWHRKSRIHCKHSATLKTH